jgi:hypothetical protein
MCFSSHRKVLFTLLVLAFLLNPAWSFAKQESSTIIWERIEGIVPVPNFNGQIIEGILPVSFPWTLEHGRAQINLANGNFEIFIKGLAIGAMPNPISPLGTTGVVTAVQGTVVCTGGGPLFDMGAIHLTETGDAFVRGRLAAGFGACNPERMVFLLRVAEVVPGAPNISDHWLAYGASRRIQGGKP